MADSTANARRIARIAGPSLVALGITEAANIDAFAGNPAPVVYLNGTLLLVAGVAIVQAHGRWARDWTALVTLTGWALVLGGLWRMIAPAAPQLSAGPATYGLLAAIAAIGGVLSWRGYAVRRET
jgi:hypothetical protein